MVFRFLENALNLCIFSHALLKTAGKILFKICFPQDQKCGESYDLEPIKVHIFILSTTSTKTGQIPYVIF